MEPLSLPAYSINDSHLITWWPGQQLLSMDHISHIGVAILAPQTEVDTKFLSPPVGLHKGFQAHSNERSDS